ncbi:MAG: AraC family transcriptional regulator [Chitinophagaceae bacterium]
MNQFVLQQGQSAELQLFPHILELGTKKNTSIRFNSLPQSAADCIRIYYIIEGKFEWSLNERPYLLYPGDVALILPGEKFGSEKGVLEIGGLSWIYITVQNHETEKIVPGKWSGLSDSENQAIWKILLLNKSLVLSKLAEAGRILQYIQNELFHHEIGYCTRVNQLIDELFITITRQLTRQTNSGRDFPRAFLQLEQTLRQNLSHQWTVEEMAAVAGMGTTLFNEKVKNFSGFSPINYLINIRISEAIKLLKKQDISVTDIALDTGFYSSQHFSTTFKKLTGYTPSEFRKRNISNNKP